MAQKKVFVRFWVLLLSLWLLPGILGCGAISNLIATPTPTMTPTPLPLTLGEQWPELADKQRIVVEGILAYPNWIDGYNLGSYGWRYGLYLTNPVNGEQIGIWFETTSAQERLPNQMKSTSSSFRHDDIWVYDNQSQVVYPGDWIRVEGRILTNNSNLAVEKVELLQSYPQIAHTEGAVGLGDEIQLIDVRWMDDKVLLIVFQSTDEFLGKFHLDVAGNDFTCKYINSYKLFCSGQGVVSGNEVVVNLFKPKYSNSEEEDLLHSEDVRIP